MNVGALRHRVRVERATEVTNEYGETARTWAKLANRWAAIEPLSGRERLLAQQVQPDVTTRVRMRWFDGMTPKDRIVFKSRVLEIDSVFNLDERDTETVCLCREIV